MNIAQKAFHALFSPPRPTPQSETEDHNPRSKKPPAPPNAPGKPDSAHRCQFTYSDGRQCRNPAKVYPQDELSPVRDRKVANERAYLCAQHSSKEEREGRGNGFPDEGLVGLCSDLTTATSINRALTQVFLLMAQGRIPQKQAVAFGYLSQLLLQTVAGVRAEYVSAFGYRQWEEELRAGLEYAPEDGDGGCGPGPSGEGSEQSSNRVVGRQKALRRELLQRESHGDQELSRFKKVDQELRGDKKEITSLLAHKEDQRSASSASQTPLREISPAPQRDKTEPDWESLYRRSLALLDRKYDFTPQGRREAKALALELELMKPPDTKPPKGRFGEVVALIRRFRAGKNPPPAAAPWLDSNGQVIKPTAAYPREWWEPKPDPAPAKSPAVSQPAPPAAHRAANPAPPISSAAPIAPPPLSARPAEPETKPGDGYYEAMHSSHAPEQSAHLVAPPSRPPDKSAVPIGKVDWLPPAPMPQPKPNHPVARADKFARAVGKMSAYRLRRFLHLQHSQGA
jgi:hypothetical protein